MTRQHKTSGFAAHFSFMPPTPFIAWIYKPFQLDDAEQMTHFFKIQLENKHQQNGY